LPPAAFSAAGRSSTAIALQAAQAAILSAPPEQRANSQAVHVPSTPLAPRLAVTPVLAELARPEAVPALALGLALDHRVRAAHLAPALLQPARRLARSAHRPEAEAVARSIPRPRKAR